MPTIAVSISLTEDTPPHPEFVLAQAQVTINGQPLDLDYPVLTQRLRIGAGSEPAEKWDIEIPLEIEYEWQG